jgi:hypothetical protein
MRVPGTGIELVVVVVKKVVSSFILVIYEFGSLSFLVFLLILGCHFSYCRCVFNGLVGGVYRGIPFISCVNFFAVVTL